MARSMTRSAVAAVCAAAVLALSSQAPAQIVPTGKIDVSHVNNTGAQSLLKPAPTPPPAKPCPTGYQGTPPNCVQKPQWDVTKNKPS